MSRTVPFAKGHGTLNDFVILTDPDGAADPTPAEVRFLCDRRAGVGGDGILRVVRGRHVEGWAGDPDAWFMDYRNADGSVSEMCGNGVRVFLVFLKDAGLIPADTQTIDIGTRAGVRTGTYLPDGTVRVWMGRPIVDAPDVTVRAAGGQWLARAIDVGNPHAVALVTADEASGLDLARKPEWTPAERFPNDANFEFVEGLGPDELRMRVYERGVGETFSCGTGTVAAASAWAAEQGRTGGGYTVHVPGGTLRVDLADGEAYLTGPARIVFRGTIDIPDLEGHG